MKNWHGTSVEHRWPCSGEKVVVVDLEEGQSMKLKNLENTYDRWLEEQWRRDSYEVESCCEEVVRYCILTRNELVRIRGCLSVRIAIVTATRQATGYEILEDIFHKLLLFFFGKRVISIICTYFREQLPYPNQTQRLP
jgi:hypothetical protein